MYNCTKRLTVAKCETVMKGQSHRFHVSTVMSENKELTANYKVIVMCRYANSS